MGNLKEVSHGKTRSVGAALELTSSRKWGVSRLRRACKTIEKKHNKSEGEEDRDEECQPEQRRNEEEREKQRKDKHSGPASHISVRGSYKHPALLRITEHRPNKT